MQHKNRFTILLTGLMLSISVNPIAAQVPSPPSPVGQDDLGIRLVTAFQEKDLNNYADLLSDDLKVYQDGKIISYNKKQWINSFGKKLVAPGVVFKLYPGFSSSNRILFIEYYNSVASWGREPPPACCWGSDAVAYDIKDGKISVIHRLRGGAKQLIGTGKPSSD